jgi:GNAT superfamily N-acetyltransferase
MPSALLTIRPAEPADAAGVAEVNLSAWQTTYRGILDDDYVQGRSSQDQLVVWRDLLAEPNPSRQYFVALEDDRVLGYCGAGRNADTHSPFQAELYGATVLPGRHGQGIGSRLLGTQAQWLRLMGWESMQCWLMEQNPFRGFYERHGGLRLDATRELDFGGKRVTVISYGWTDLDALIQL